MHNPWMRRVGLSVLLLATACGDKEPVVTDDSDETAIEESTPPPTDADGDGYPEADDCDDGDAAVFPGAEELCNSVDDNCNGVVDEGFPDADGDLTADCVDTEDCDGADNDGDGAVDEGHSDLDGDGLADCLDVEECDGVDNDGDAAVDEGFDADSDGYSSCEYAAEVDCDDSEPAVNPSVAEADADLIDNDCDGLVDEGQWVEGDLVIIEVMSNPGQVADPEGEWLELLNNSGRTLILNGLTLTSADDDGHQVSSEELLSVGAGEVFVLGVNAQLSTNGQAPVDYQYSDLVLGNETDDLTVSAGAVLLDTITWDDGYSWPDAAGASMTLDPANLNHTDNDGGGLWCPASDPWVSRGDLGSPGVVNPPCGTLDRDSDGFTGEEGDCDDFDAAVNPNAAEIWYDGIDQNCDGLSDYDADGDVFDSVSYSGDDCVDSDASINPSATEIWYDGIDQNCDGLSDYDADGDGFDSISGGGTDCIDDDPLSFLGATEACDGLDNDCDNATDEYPCVSTCGDSVLDTNEEYDPPPGPYSNVIVDSAECRWDFSGVNQLYCNGGCSWAGSSSCDQADADILCQLITGNPASTATSYSTPTALPEAGFPCSPLGYGTAINIVNRGVSVNVTWQDTSIQANHGSGTVVAYPTCTDP